MHPPTLIVITGHPGSGKTSIGRQLGARYNIPFASKDRLKEYMFDALGAGDKTWSLKTSAAAHRILDYWIVEELRTGHSVIGESNFKKDLDSKRFQDAADKYDASLLQIMCKASGKVLFKRWVARIQTGERHEGHAEAIGLEQIKKDLAGPYPALQLSGQLITLDTSDFSTVELPELHL